MEDFQKPYRTAPCIPPRLNVPRGTVADFVGESATASELSVEATGVSWIVLEGESVVEVDKCKLHAHGSAEIKEAHCETLNVAATDEAKIEVHLHGTATGTVSGKAELEVVGGGDTTGVTVSNEGKIKHTDHGDE